MQDNISLMSIGFLLGGPDEAVIWRGPKKNGRLSFLCDHFVRELPARITGLYYNRGSEIMRDNSFISKFHAN